MEEALEDLRDGKPVLVFDSGDREGETDIVYAAESADYRKIARLRNDAGGIICTCLPFEVAESLELPFFEEVMDRLGFEGEHEPGYDSRSSFSIWANHRSTFTGVTDRDRAKTSRELARAAREVEKGKEVSFEERFRVPGHVAVLKAARNTVHERRGHTEMSVFLLREAGATPVSIICEMMDGETGRALSRERARKYAEEHDLVFLEGKDIIERAASP